MGDAAEVVDMSDTSERTTFLEFMIPFLLEDERNGEMKPAAPQHMTIDINMKGRMQEKYTTENWGEYPPASEAACEELARDLEENLDDFIRNGYIRDVGAPEHGITAVADLDELRDDIFWIY